MADASFDIDLDTMHPSVALCMVDMFHYMELVDVESVVGVDGVAVVYL